MYVLSTRLVHGGPVTVIIALLIPPPHFLPSCMEFGLWPDLGRSASPLPVPGKSWLLLRTLELLPGVA